MSEEKKHSPVGKIILILFLTLFILIIVSVIYIFAVLNGRAPVPKAAVTVLAEKANLPANERESLEKALNVYTILQSSDISEEVTELRKSAVRGASDEEIQTRVHQIYTSLPGETLEDIRMELEMTPEDFIKGKDIIDNAMEDFASTGEFLLSREEENTLRALAEKYGLSEESMSSFSGKW